jgi:hypothetical protein
VVVAAAVAGGRAGTDPAPAGPAHGRDGIVNER